MRPFLLPLSPRHDLRRVDEEAQLLCVSLASARAVSAEEYSRALAVRRELNQLLVLEAGVTRDELRPLARSLVIENYFDMSKDALQEAIEGRCDSLLGPDEAPPNAGEKRRALRERRAGADDDDVRPGGSVKKRGAAAKVIGQKGKARNEEDEEDADGEESGDSGAGGSGAAAEKTAQKTTATRKPVLHPREIGKGKNYARAGVVCTNCHFPKSWHAAAAYGDLCPHPRCEDPDNCPCTLAPLMSVLHPGYSGSSGSGAGGSEGSSSGAGGSGSKKPEAVMLAEIEYKRIADQRKFDLEMEKEKTKQKAIDEKQNAADRKERERIAQHAQELALVESESPRQSLRHSLRCTARCDRSCNPANPLPAPHRCATPPRLSFTRSLFVDVNLELGHTALFLCYDDA